MRLNIPKDLEKLLNDAFKYRISQVEQTKGPIADKDKIEVEAWAENILRQAVLQALTDKLKEEIYAETELPQGKEESVSDG